MRDRRRYAGALLVLMTIHCDQAPAESARSAEPVKAVADAKSLVAPGSAPIQWVVATPVVDTSGDQTVEGQQLLVDLGAPAGTGMVKGWLFTGELAMDPDVDLPSRIAMENEQGRSVRALLYGGVDAPRPLVHNDVAPGKYTVCAQVGPEGVHPVTDWNTVPVVCSHVAVTDSLASRAVALKC